MTVIPWDIPHVTDLGHDHVRFVPVQVTKIRDMCAVGPAMRCPGKIDGAGRLAGRATPYCHELLKAALAIEWVLTEETTC